MSDFETRPEEKVEEEGVEEDTVDDRPCKVCQLAPKLGVVGIPKR